jgi:hypothetical protein
VATIALVEANKGVRREEHDGHCPSK